MKNRAGGDSIPVRLLVSAVFVAALGLSLGGTARAASTSLRGTQAAPAGGMAANLSIMPDAVPSLPPAQQAVTLRYPLYGPASQGVAEGVPAPGVPPMITLDQARKIAAAMSPALAAARADVGVAAAAVRLERAGLLPSISANASSAHVWSGGGSSRLINAAGAVTTVTAGNANTQQNSGSISLNQLIFDGGQIEAGVRAAKHTETAAADTYRRELQTLNLNVAQAYYSALSAERTTQVDIELVRENSVQEQLVAAEVKAGTAARVDQITAQLPVAQAQVAAVQAQGAQIAALATLANVLGLPANTAVQPVDDGQILSAEQSRKIAEEIPAPTFEQAMSRANALRPDLDAAKQTVQAAQDSLRQARLGYMPRIEGSYATGISSMSIGGGNYGHSNTLGAQLSLPIFDPGAIPAQIAQAKANLAVQQANQRATELAVSLSVRQGLSGLVSAQAALRASVVSLQEATEILHSTQAQYRAGVTTLPQLLNAQVGLSQALVSQVSASYTLRQAEQAFFYALGEDPAI